MGAAKPRPAPVPPADINSDRRYGWYSAHRTNVPLRTVPSPASHNSVGSIEQPPLGICSYHGLFGGGRLIGEVVEVKPDGNRIVQFTCEGNFYTALEEVGQMPLPPYIHEKLKDKERYQTVYSKELGSAAAPTAGLHFTKDMLKKLKEKGVNEAYVTLHVGLGTFRPVKEDDVLQHQMHSEHYHLPQETVDMIRETKANGGRVIAVGTTSCRTLEAVATAHNGELVAEDGYTDIFIYPGYSFKVLDGLITNFHLPESTLIMLISAFLGYEKTMHAYEIAVQEKYRFFSFGDAMCILPEKSE